MANKKEIAVCIVVNDLFVQTKYVIENLTQRAQEPIRLHILDNNSLDERISVYLKELCATNKWYYKKVSETLSLAKCYNMLLTTVYQQYCCIYPVNVLVRENWLSELKLTSNTLKEPGVLGIRNAGEKKYILTSFLQNSTTEEDELEEYWRSANNEIDGIMFFKTEMLKKTGVYNEDLNAKGFENNDLCFRASAHLMYNVYVKNQVSAKIPTENETLFPVKTEEAALNYKQNIESMAKSRLFYCEPKKM